MPRNIVQDVIPKGGRRSIRDISSGYTGRAQNKEEEEKTEAVEERVVHRPSQQRPSSESHSRFFLWLISAVAVLVLAFILSNTFSGATVTVTPKSQIVSVNLDFVAKTRPSAGELGFVPLSIVKDKDVTVVADSEQKMETRATGKIIVYNNYSVSVQRLVKNTRFETPDGLIYRITDSVMVPGRYSLNGQLVPGSIEATVQADMVGSEYNIGLTDFTVPGFKSDPNRFSSFYGRSKTPMTGGKVGIEKVVSQAKSAEIKKQLQSELKDAVLAEIRSQVSDDSVFYDGAFNITFETVPAGNNAGGNNIILRERAHATAFIFKRDNIARSIAQGVLKTFDSSPLTVQSKVPIHFQLKSPLSFDSAVTGPIRFSLDGEAVLIWEINEAMLKSELAGVSKKV
ncbi:MAG: hypothetical protein EXS59_01330, partial [Candidatus Taylorbacteria bacterium]|nr:hypothetical protein [Candidatus Taylorbacteria bacterium]